MTLAILVYLVALLGPLASAFEVISGLAAVLAVPAGIAYAIHVFDSPSMSYLSKDDQKVRLNEWESHKNSAKKVLKYSIIVSIIFGLFSVLLPKEKTAYVMLGAYATQKVAEDPRTQEIGGKVLKMINNKLDSYVEEMTDKVTK